MVFHWHHLTKNFPDRPQDLQQMPDVDDICSYEFYVNDFTDFFYFPITCLYFLLRRDLLDVKNCQVFGQKILTIFYEDVYIIGP
jgi:hypothetical protein